MKSIWKKKCRNLFLIMIGILMFIACVYAENVIKPDGGNPLLKNLRVTRTWASTGSCITTLDAKWIEPTVVPEAKALTAAGQLTILWVTRDIMGWKKDQARVFGIPNAVDVDELWKRSEPIRDLIDLATPAEEFLGLEWWDTYSQYRILFTRDTAADIDKLVSYINEMIAKDAMSKAMSKRIKRTGGEEVGLWHVGKMPLKGVGAEDGRGNITKYPDPDVGWKYPFAPGSRPLFMEYIKPTSGGPHRVVLDPRIHTDLNPFIYEADAYPSASRGVKLVSDRSGWDIGRGWAPKGCEELGEWGPKAYPDPDIGWIWWPKAKPSIRIGPDPIPVGEKECFNCPEFTEVFKPTPGGGPPARGYSDKDKGGV